MAAGWIGFRSCVEDAATRLQDNLEQFYSHNKTDTVAERWHRVVMKAAMVHSFFSFFSSPLLCTCRGNLKLFKPHVDDSVSQCLT